jgi:8-oxo-dGTP pyrophosphatase MutT (NUDIX family)
MTLSVRTSPIAAADIRLSDEPWAFARRHAGAIAAHWARRTSEQSALFNGEVVLLRRWSLRDGRFSGECIRADFKSFLYWREHDYPDSTVFDFFAAAALHSGEGWLILGRSGSAMSNAGKIYPPCGSLQLDDLDGNCFDLERSVIREVHEETGITLAPRQLGPALLIQAEPQIVVVRPVRLDRSAADIVAAISRHLRNASHRELAEIVMVKGADDIEARDMPPFTAAYIRYAFGN